MILWAWAPPLPIAAKAEGMFRESPILPERLWQVIEDAKADISARAAAAIALSRTMSEQDRSRLRIAARATAAPKLRIALEAAAQDDEARMVEALSDMEPEEARQTT